MCCPDLREVNLDAIRHLPGIGFFARREVDTYNGRALSSMNIAWANPVADIVVAAEGIAAILTAAAVALPPQDLALIVSEDYFSRDVTGVLLETLHKYRATFPNYHPLVQGVVGVKRSMSNLGVTQYFLDCCVSFFSIHTSLALSR